MPQPLALNIPIEGATAGSVLPSASRTTTQSVDVTNYSGAGVEVIVNVSIIGTGSITLHIRGRDPISGNYIDILVGAAIVGNTTTRYRVYPGIAVVANATASDVVPNTFNIQIVANNANAVTYSVAAYAIP